MVGYKHSSSLLAQHSNRRHCCCRHRCGLFYLFFQALDSFHECPHCKSRCAVFETHMHTAHAHTHMHTYTFIHTRTYTHTHIHAHVHVHTYTHAHNTSAGNGVGTDAWGSLLPSTPAPQAHSTPLHSDMAYVDPSSGFSEVNYLNACFCLCWCACVCVRVC